MQVWIDTGEGVMGRDAKGKGATVYRMRLLADNTLFRMAGWREGQAKGRRFIRMRLLGDHTLFRV